MFFENFRVGFGDMVLSSILVFLLFHLCCIAGLSHSLTSYGFSHQRNSLALFFFKHSRHGKCSWCRWVFFLESVVVVVVTTTDQLWGRGLDSLALFLSLDHPSSPALKGGACSWVCSCCRQIFGERKKTRACSPFWKKCLFLSPCCVYTLPKCKGVFGCWTKAVLIPLLGYPCAGFYSHSRLG